MPAEVTETSAGIVVAEDIPLHLSGVIERNPSVSVFLIGLQKSPAGLGAFAGGFLHNGEHTFARVLPGLGVACSWSFADVQVGDCDPYQIWDGAAGRTALCYRAADGAVRSVQQVNPARAAFQPAPAGGVDLHDGERAFARLPLDRAAHGTLAAVIQVGDDDLYGKRHGGQGRNSDFCPGVRACASGIFVVVGLPISGTFGLDAPGLVGGLLIARQHRIGGFQDGGGVLQRFQHGGIAGKLLHDEFTLLPLMPDGHARRRHEIKERLLAGIVRPLCQPVTVAVIDEIGIGAAVHSGGVFRIGHPQLGVARVLEVVRRQCALRIEVAHQPCRAIVVQALRLEIGVHLGVGHAAVIRSRPKLRLERQPFALIAAVGIPPDDARTQLARHIVVADDVAGVDAVLLHQVLCQFHRLCHRRIGKAPCAVVGIPDRPRGIGGADFNADGIGVLRHPVQGAALRGSVLVPAAVPAVAVEPFIYAQH